MKKYNAIKGKAGEVAAQCYLIENGYNILKTNYRCIFGEIDIIAFKNNTIVFVEVKYRKTINYGYPCEAVDYKKQIKIINTAKYYLSENDSDGYNNRFDIDYRFDVIEVLGLDMKINHIENGFIVGD